MKRILIAIALFVSAEAHAQTTLSPGQHTTGPNRWEVYMRVVPNTLTAMTPAATPAVLETLNCATGNASGTISVFDNAATIAFVFGVSLAANTTYTLNYTPTLGMGGATSATGFQWSSTGTVSCTAVGRF